MTKRMRRQPLRMCIGCRQKKTKRKLVRIVRTPEGRVVVDNGGKLPGRGAYLCADRICWQKALEGQAIQRALKGQVSEEDMAYLWDYAEGLDDH